MLRLIVIVALVVAAPAAGETFQLRSGGRLEGRLLNPDELPRQTYHIRLLAGGDVTLEVKDVAKVIEPTPAKRQYLDLLRRMPADTAEMHWKMSEACAKWNLGRERKFHLERAIELDPNHEQARQALKFKKQSDGTWATAEQLRTAAGQVKYKGKWMSPDAVRIAKAKEERKDAEIAWKKKLRMWRGWLKDGGRRKETALEEIEAIEDPVAAKPLSEMFWSDSSQSMRMLIADVLGRMKSGVAVNTLARAALEGNNEDDNEIRLYSVKILERNNRRAVVPAFVGELRSKSNARVRRAAYAIGVLGDDSAVLPLIKALRTKHTRLVGGMGNGNINARNGGLSVGRTKPKRVDEWEDNPEVLDALVRLTDVNFNYRVRDWLRWYESQTTPPEIDLRRDS